eukprot:gene5488-5555_t
MEADPLWLTTGYGIYLDPAMAAGIGPGPVQEPCKEDSRQGVCTRGGGMWMGAGQECPSIQAAPLTDTLWTWATARRRANKGSRIFAMPGIEERRGKDADNKGTHKGRGTVALPELREEVYS